MGRKTKRTGKPTPRKGGGKAGGLSAPRTAAKGEGEPHQVGLRLPWPLLARLDAYVERLQGELPGLAITRSDAARILLAKALDAEGIEAE